MGIRVTSNGPGALLGAAMIPVPAKDRNAWQARGLIFGSPGTARIPAPAPIPGYDQQGAAKAIAGVGAGGMGQPSSIYSFWRPSVYYTRTPTPQNMAVSYVSDNQMPCPAVDPRGRPSMWSLGRSPRPAMGGPPLLRQFQVVQPRQLPKWLDRNGRIRRG